MKVKAKISFIARRKETLLELKEGQETEITDREFLESLIGLVTICDYYPTVSDYKVAKEFDGHQIGETVSLFSDQAGQLVLAGQVTPIDDKLWRRGRPLPDTTKSFTNKSYIKGLIKDAFNF